MIPGAGEMYLGMFRSGTCLMSLFCISIFMASTLFSPLLLFSIIIWFYSFFHTNNINSLPKEEFEQLEDDFMYLFSGNHDTVYFLQKHKKLCSGILIFIGAMILYSTFFDTVFLLLPERFRFEFRELLSNSMRAIIGIGCVYIGCVLIRGKKHELLDHYDFEEYEEENVQSPLQNTESK